MNSSPQLYHAIEQLTLNAWPALRQYSLDGWTIRLADGYTKRANSVQPIGEIPDPGDLRERIAHCERLYAAEGLPAIFKMSPFAAPSSLDQSLEELGYRIADPSLVLVRSLDGLPEPSPAMSADLTAKPTDEWLERFAQWNRVTPPELETARKLLDPDYPLKRFFTLRHDGIAVACGMGAVERGYIGLYDIVTDPERRNQGLGEQLLLRILGWARGQGAHSGYLQVLAANAPAMRLYGKLGYAEAYPYWYRVQQSE